jgi:endonuclease/exonuclease/phosphatase family metal-dependent hydrolase
MTPITVASHNLMHAIGLPALIAHYVALRDAGGLDLLCLQEDRFLTDEADRPSDRIAAALGPDYQVVRHQEGRGLAFVHDTRTLACGAHALAPLPLLARLTPFERLYIRGGKTKQKYVLLAELRPRGGHARFAAACFHLDTAGGNDHRASQVEAIAAALGARGLDRAFVACGDTNAFAWRRQPEALERLMAPLAALGATDPETRPTHYFARQKEGKLVHQTGVLLGKIGIDRPLRYDVVCTNLPVAARGQIDTPASDHDLVWARLSIQPLTPGPSED